VPAKKRKAKRRAVYSPVIRALIAGEPIAPSQDAKSELISVMYFRDPPEIADDEELRQRAAAVFRSWPDDWEEQAAHAG
jgi:hypothetical protein